MKKREREYLHFKKIMQKRFKDSRKMFDKLWMYGTVGFSTSIDSLGNVRTDVLDFSEFDHEKIRKKLLEL